MDKTIKDTVSARGKLYGPPKPNHTNIGLGWTGKIQQYYGIELPFPIPAELVALLMTDLKVNRACNGIFHEDNFIDGHAYFKFAEEFQSSLEDEVQEVTND